MEDTKMPEAEPELAPEPEGAIYVAPNSPKLSTSVMANGQRYNLKFHHGRLAIDEATYGEDWVAIAEALDKALARPSNTALRVAIRKVDHDVGEALVREHMKQRKSGAVKGSFDSSARTKMMTDAIRARDAELIAQGATPEEVAQFGDMLQQAAVEQTKRAEPSPPEQPDASEAKSVPVPESVPTGLQPTSPPAASPGIKLSGSQ